jgi:hypothetical protein
MNLNEHNKYVGEIVRHLQSLELVLRLFLCEEMGEKAQLPQPGETTVLETWLTNYQSLGELVCAYNLKLTDIESPRYAVDKTIVTVRDALAHGRLLAQTPSPPLTLFKFGRPKKRIVPVESVDVLTEEWLRAKTALTYDQVTKVAECAKARGHQWLD